MSDYQWYKSHGICTRCRAADASPGRVLCPDCAEKVRQSMKQRYQKEYQKEYQKKYRKQYRARKRAAGICYACDNQAAPGRVLCEECAKKRREYQRKHRREKETAKRREGRRALLAALKRSKKQNERNFTDLQ